MTASRLGVGVLGIVLAATSALTSAVAPAHARVGGHDHGPLIERPAQGRAARAALDALDPAGQRTVAARNDRSVAQVRAILADPTAGLARDGKLFYTETADRAAAPAAALPAASVTLAEAFTLHSHAGSTRTIYLDFDGYSVPAGTGWPANGIPAATYPGSFGASDAAYVETVWRVVAEKYAAFDVDVTTQQPPLTDLTWDGPADTRYGSRAVFTDSAQARGSVCPSSGCIGIAFIDVFRDDTDGTKPGYYEPAWIYTTWNGGTLSAVDAANTAAHEVGHNLNLEHDTTTGAPNGYYEGHDDWFPLMGSSWRAIGQWNDTNDPQGYANALTSQIVKSDVATMDAAGLPARADDVPGTLALGQQTVRHGVISTRTDTDTFTVDRTCTDPMTVSATGIGLGQSLDIGLTVTPPGGASTTIDPASGHAAGDVSTPAGMDATFSSPGTAQGTWTFTVDGVGLPGPTGYSDYGSIGQYTLAVTGSCPVVVPDRVPGAPTGLDTSVATHATSMDVSWTAPEDAGKPALTGYDVTLTPQGGGDPLVQTPTVTSTSFEDLTPGTTYDVSVVATNSTGASEAEVLKDQRVPSWAPETAPTVTATVSGQRGTLALTPAANPGNAVLDHWTIEVRKAGVSAITPVEVPAGTPGWQSPVLPAGTYTAVVTPAYTADDPAPAPGGSTGFAIVTRPSAPRIGTATSGATGRPVTARARWSAPLSTGNAPVLGYQVVAYRFDSRGRVIATRTSSLRPASARSYMFALPAGRYRFKVRALNQAGWSAYSGRSAIVTAR